MTPLQDHLTSQLPTERDEPDPTKKGSQSTCMPKSTSISDLSPAMSLSKLKRNFPQHLQPKALALVRAESNTVNLDPTNANLPQKIYETVRFGPSLKEISQLRSGRDQVSMAAKAISNEQQPNGLLVPQRTKWLQGIRLTRLIFKWLLHRRTGKVEKC